MLDLNSVAEKLNDESVRSFLMKWKYKNAPKLHEHDFYNVSFKAIRRTLKNFDPEKGKFNSSLAHYLNWETKNHYGDLQRENHVRQYEDEEELGLDFSHEKSIEDEDRLQKVKILAKKHLPKEYRDVLLACVVDGKTTTEVAESQGIGYQTVVERLNDAVSKLKQIVQQEEELE